MSEPLKFNVAAHPPRITRDFPSEEFSGPRLDAFNERHIEVLARYGIQAVSIRRIRIDEKTNGRSNLGVFRNKQLNQSVLLAAGLPAIAVALTGRGAFAALPKAEQTPDRKEALKRSNDRVAALAMGETFQHTCDALEAGEDVLISTAITEGVRAKPGYEAGGNPTIAVGAVFGKAEIRARYGRPMPRDVTLLSMGNDVIDGTTKSVMGTHSSLTSVFLSESGVKRHLPDIYVQRWAAAVPFEEFNPRDLGSADVARLFADAYGIPVEQMSAFFIDRPRHVPAIEALNRIGVSTPMDTDGDLFPGVLLGVEGISFPDGRGLMSMIGEIGGSAEWAVAVLPLVWRGGNALGMLTSQSSIQRKDLSPEELWAERFHYTADELLMIQDARFELKPWFTIEDIMENPYAGGVSAFGAITDNIYLPTLKGVRVDEDAGRLCTSVLTVNSLGLADQWDIEFEAAAGVGAVRDAMRTPKELLRGLDQAGMERAIGAMTDHPTRRETFRIFFGNEYYGALAHSVGRMMVLDRTVRSLIERGALEPLDTMIIAAAKAVVPDWFI
ncbi:MAG: fructose-bisphosphatase class II [Pseudomonadota bacterium]